MRERKSLKQKIKLCTDKERCYELQQEIEDIDVIIAKECSEENYEKIKDNLQGLADQSDILNTNGVWNIMKKIFPKNVQPLPVAKRNANGQIITNPEAFKELYKETYIQRLRQMPSKQTSHNNKF